jgi:hypothetical protein
MMGSTLLDDRLDTGNLVPLIASASSILHCFKGLMKMLLLFRSCEVASLRSAAALTKSAACGTSIVVVFRDVLCLALL